MNTETFTDYSLLGNGKIYSTNKLNLMRSYKKIIAARTLFIQEEKRKDELDELKNTKRMQTDNSNIVEKYDLRQISKEIIGIKMNGNKTINELIKEFYSIMVKHNITMMHSVDEGKTQQGNCFEYTICKELFKSQFGTFLNFCEWGLEYGNFIKVPKKMKCKIEKANKLIKP